jgi:DNA-binding beta-propeller fold protein YncE
MRRRIPALLALLWAAHAASGAGPQERIEVIPVRTIYGHLLAGRFLHPAGVAYDAVAREIFVTDLLGRCVGIADDRGVPIFTFGSAEVFKTPSRIAVDPEGRIYVADMAGHAVLVFDYDGEPLGEVDLSGAPAAERPLVPVGLARASDGTFYVLDSANRRVLVISPDGALATIGAPAGRVDLMRTPMDLELTPEGKLVISDAAGLAVQVYGPAGDFLLGWGRHDVGTADFSLPSGVAVDGSGRVYVVDGLRHDVKVFTPQGEFLTHFGGWGVGLGGLRYPVDVASDGGDRVFVTERGGQRVQVFRVRTVP